MNAEDGDTDLGGGRHERAASEGESLRDVQNVLMTATKNALDRGYGPGMVVDTDLIEADLLVEAIDEAATDPGAEGSEGSTPDTDGTRPHSDGGDTSVFDAYADRWYRPDSETYGWAVRTSDGDRRYFKTRDGARERLRTEYE